MQDEDEEMHARLIEKDRLGTIEEFKFWFALGLVFNLAPVAVAICFRRSLACGRGALAGAGICSLTVAIGIFVSIFFTNDTPFALIASLTGMCFSSLVAPVALMGGIDGYCKVRRMKTKYDMAVALISGILVFLLLVATIVLLLIRGLMTAM